MVLVLTAPAVAFLLAACQEETNRPVGADGTPAARVLSPDTAAFLIASARCDHEVACGAVGAGRTYSAREQCASELQRSAQEDLTTQSLFTRNLARKTRIWHLTRHGAQTV